MNIKKILLFCYLLFPAITYGQNMHDNQTYITEFQKVVFVTSDTVFDFTLFIEQNGIFYLKKGYEKSEFHESKTYYKFENRQVSNIYNLKYLKSSFEIDTINSYLPIKSKAEVDNKITEEVLYAYIMKQLGESNIINSSSSKRVLRFLYPCSDSNHATKYNLAKLVFFNDSVKLYGISGQSKDFSGINITRKYSTLLNNLEI